MVGQVQGRNSTRAGTLREERFKRQKGLGVIPADAKLTPAPEEIPAWDSLADDQRGAGRGRWECSRGTARNADWNIGRVINAVAEMGELDNTLVIYIFGDNGASMEGAITGSVQRAHDAGTASR